MRRLLICVVLSLLTISIALAVSIGSGSPTPEVQQSFINASNRGQFSLLVALPPLNDVHALGSPGLVQEFAAKAGGTARYALIKPDPAAPVSQFDTLQVYNDIYPFYTAVGTATAGYPLNDTQVCPANSLGVCNYQAFSKNYALFAYSAPSMNIAVRDPFYTAWNAAGGISGTAGAVIGAESTVTSPTKVQAVQQLFDGAAIFSYPASSTTPTVHSVLGSFRDSFNAAGGYSVLGFPTSEALTVGTTGLVRQTFELGRIEQLPNQVPAVLLAISEVDITFANQGLILNAGATATVTATTLDLRGTAVTDRTLTWNTTNGTVATVTSNGYSAVVLGVGAGTTNIYVTAEGKTSAPLTVRVGSVCCGVGEGAPTPALTQAFQAALIRNNIPLSLSASTLVTRQGAGYVQSLSTADGSAVVLALADNSSTVWVMSGPLYAAYLSMGGFTGPLGYPASDILPGGVQKLTSGAALAGSPVRVLPAVIAAKWFQLGGASGGVGAPLADAQAFNSLSGVAGFSQAFAGGTIFGISGGATAGQAYLSSGPILSRYLALDGTAGALGTPVSDIFISGGAQQQNFETGYIDFQPGAVAAVEHFNPRHPAISVLPATVVPGGRVHISATGFAPASTIAFSITGQTGFFVQNAAGAYSWDVVIPAAAKSGTVTIQASAKPGSDVASGSYTITTVPALLPKFTVVSGDLQTGAPGSALPVPITAILLDSAGLPIAGVPVSWTVSPGASLQSNFVTDSNGRVSAVFRLPPASGVAVGSLAAGGKVVEFSALATGRSIQGFPALSQTGPKGSLVAALASLLRYYQNVGTLPVVSGPASPGALNSYLSASGGFSPADSGVLIANPWVAAQFAKASLFSESTSSEHMLDLAGAGTPFIAVLRLTLDGAEIGSSAVDVTGVNADGSLVISDPDSSYVRNSLSDYLNGFAYQGHLVRGVVTAVLRVGPLPAAAGSYPFVIASPLAASASAASSQGSCPALDLLDGPASGVRYLYCNGAQGMWQLDLAASRAATIVDLTGLVQPVSLPANGTTSWRLSRTGAATNAAPQSLSISGITDSAAFGAEISPGGLFSIFGAGFSGASTVTIDGKAVPVIAAFPFQINAQLPPGTPAGKATLQVSGISGTATVDIDVSAISPGIFVVGPNAQGAILNFPDNTLNSSGSPAQRGQFISIYATGLGATILRNGFQVVAAPVTALVNSVVVPAQFTGLVPGFVGLYQVNVQLPASLPPSLVGSLALQQGARTSNTVLLAEQ